MFPALVRCAHGPLGPRPRPYGADSLTYSLGLLAAATAALCLTVAACGGGESIDPGAAVETAAVGSEAGPAATAPAGGAGSTRSGAGIAAAGGNPRAVGGDPSCGQHAESAGEPITIAYVGANLAELEAIGLETIVVEEPGIAIAAYVNELNFNGGIHGRCIELVIHLWSLADPAASLGRLCTQLPQQQPLVMLSLGVQQTAFECITLAAKVPTLGLFGTMADAQFAAARGRLFVDQGSEEYLMSSGVDIALQAGELTLEDRIGLFDVASGTITLAIEQAGLTVAESAIVPPEFGDLGVLRVERQARLLEGGLSAADQQATQLFRQQLAPDQAQLLTRIEQHFLEIAGDFRDAGVTTVVAGAGWADVRRLMRAADLLGWYPRWITNDSQAMILVLSRAPARQAGNLIQISARRAAGDDLPEVDRSCLSLRNTFSTAAVFSHRFHTDAWNLLTSVCDYLDVIFGAISRVDGPLTRDAFMEAMAGTHYETALGSLIKYDRTDYFGSDRFRVLRADPSCVLNSWGCMRAASDWLTPS